VEESMKAVLAALKDHFHVLNRNPKAFGLSRADLDKLFERTEEEIQDDDKLMSRFLKAGDKLEQRLRVYRSLRSSATVRRSARHKRPSRGRKPPPKGVSFRAPCGRTIIDTERPSAFLVLKGWPDAEKIYRAPIYRPIVCLKCEEYEKCLNFASEYLWQGWCFREDDGK